MIYTYQDLLKVADDDRRKMEFARSLINNYKDSELYENAVLAKEYDRRRNRTILSYQKLLHTMSGRSVPDNFSANYKMCSNFFDFFVTQENQYLLGNGVTWQNTATAGKLGDDFDTQLSIAGKKALVEGEAFGFWNLDHLEVFGASEFVPLYDEENGALMAGVRFWQIDKLKPLRATLYEKITRHSLSFRYGAVRKSSQSLSDCRKISTHTTSSSRDLPMTLTTPLRYTGY